MSDGGHKPVGDQPVGDEPVGDDTRRTSLAAERTLLAWWRTGIAALVVALGAGGIIPDLVAESRPRWPYVAIGCGFALVGVISIVYGTLRGRATESSGSGGEWSSANERVLWGITAVLLALALGLLVLLIASGSA